MDRISSSFLLRVKHLVISLTSQLILRKELKQISVTNYLMVTVVEGCGGHGTGLGWSPCPYQIVESEKVLSGMIFQSQLWLLLLLSF